MPREITTSEDQHFTQYHSYSYSECGNYDDSTGWTVCNHCGATVADEYEYASDVEIDWHKSGVCKQDKAMRLAAESVGRAFGNLLQRCTFCRHVACDCPF